MFGVSFLIVMVNVLARELARTRFNILFGKPKREFVLGCALVFSFVILSLLYGLYRLQPEKKASSLTITVVQADIPQEMKWQPSAWPFIMAKHLTLTKAAAAQKPDLIIWPETAFPGFIWESPQLFEDLRAFVAEIKIPLLLGLVIQEEDRYYNSVVLISKDGEIIARHDKLHLVPFGEYVPLRKTFPVLTDIVPIGDFTAGKTWTIFPQGFSVLICFEDTVPEISRGFVKKGANLLVNMTNDAWFKDTKAPFLHMQAAVFRAVENRRTLIRAANTGVSCFIDRNGRVLNSVKDEQGKTTYVAGYKLENVSFENEKTFYTKYEDVFTYLCFGVILWGIVTRNKRNFAKKI